MVLVGSVVFAGFTGNIETSFGADLEAGTWGFASATEITSEVTVFETLVDNAGEGDIWAEISAELTFVFDYAESATNGDATAPVANAEITAAKIASDDWYVSILGAGDAPNFASSAIDENAAEEALDMSPVDYFGPGVGVEVGYAGYVLSFAADRTFNALDASNYEIFGAVTTPDFALGDGLTAALGVAGMVEDIPAAAVPADKKGSVSAKVSYADDMMSADVAADVLLDATSEFEVSAAVAVDPVTVDVYYASVDDGFEGDTDYAYGSQDDILSAKVVGTVDAATITFTGKDLLNSTDLSAEVSYAVSDELTVGVNGGFVVDTEAWSVGASAAYALSADWALAADATYASAETLEVNVSLESTTLVDGATIAISYESADVLTDNGKLLVAATLEF